MDGELGDVRGPVKFSPEGEASSVAIKWEEWLEEFEAFADAKGIFDREGTGKNSDMRARRKALLLYQAGARVREIVKGFEATAHDDYAGLVEKLTDHFKVEVNPLFRDICLEKCHKNQKSQSISIVPDLEKLLLVVILVPQ